ncbi:MAG: hypothetical protein E7256_12900 [Lachnospiraceae bacterium]|nr:hypothetical protein [Lachnospiraceae bacterium]
MKERSAPLDKSSHSYYNMDVLSTLRNINGKNASNGHNGRNGFNGTNGSNGANGRNGVNGANGLNGTNGADGISPSFLQPYIPGTVYHAGDVIYFEGGTYVVTALGTTKNPITAPNEYQQISAPGEEGIGLQNVKNYVNGATYEENDLIYFNGSLYLVTASFTSGNPDTAPNDFTPLINRGAPGISITNTVSYQPGVTYDQNQFVYYNGSNYLVKAWQTSSSPDEAPEDYSKVIQKGATRADLRTLVTYDPGTIYTTNDLVCYNGSTYLVTAQSTTGSPDTNPNEYLLIAQKGADGANLPALQVYTDGTTYFRGDPVYYNGSTYVVTANSVTASPDVSPSSFIIISRAGANGAGLNGVVNYTAGTTYPQNTLIFYQGSTYIVTAFSTSKSPSEAPGDYQVLAAKGNDTSGIVTFTTGGPLTLTFPAQDYFTNSAYVGSVSGIASTTNITQPINFTNTPQLTTAYTITIPLCGTLTELEIWFHTYAPTPQLNGGGYILSSLLLADVGSFAFRRLPTSSATIYQGTSIPAGLTLRASALNINQSVSRGQKLMLVFYAYSAGPTTVQSTLTFSAIASATITGFTCP